METWLDCVLEPAPIGDFNFDWHVEQEDYEHSQAFDELTEDGAFI